MDAVRCTAYTHIHILHSIHIHTSHTTIIRRRGIFPASLVHCRCSHCRLVDSRLSLCAHTATYTCVCVCVGNTFWPNNALSGHRVAVAVAAFPPDAVWPVRGRTEQMGKNCSRSLEWCAPNFQMGDSASRVENTIRKNKTKIVQRKPVLARKEMAKHAHMAGSCHTLFV